MPVVTLYYSDLERLVGEKKERIIEKLPMLGCGIEREESDHIDVEFFPDRPDLFSIEGVARAMRGFLGIEKGLPEYEVSPSNLKMEVRKDVKGIRPWVVGALVKNLSLDGYAIESIMKLQENLHWTIGRNRRKVSIGIHDAENITPPLSYLSAPQSHEFVPLDCDEKLSMRDILTKHPKGVEFSYILEGHSRYPLIIDSKGNTLSFPPIINAEHTRVKESTRDILVEVTGMDHTVLDALNIVATALSERGGKIFSILILDGRKKTQTPDLRPREHSLLLSSVKNLLGVDISKEECRGYLERMRFGCSFKNGRFHVKIPAYRTDIMHSWDLIEDIAKGYGYDRISPEFPKVVSIGEPHPLEEKKSVLRELMVGLGYFEVLTFTLTNERKNFELMCAGGRATRIKNPISEEQTILRTWLLPGLLEVCSLNRHRELPLRIFEVGEVVIQGKDRCHLAAVSIHSKASFSEVRAIADAVFSELFEEVKIKKSDHPSFLSGRRADVWVKDKKIGFFGEIHPQVLLNFGLEHPAVGMELEVDG